MEAALPDAQHKAVGTQRQERPQDQIQDVKCSLCPHKKAFIENARPFYKRILDGGNCL